MEDVELVQSMPRSPCRSSSRTCRRRYETGGGVGGLYGGPHTMETKEHLGRRGEEYDGGGGGGGDGGGGDGRRCDVIMGDPEKLAK